MFRLRGLFVLPLLAAAVLQPGCRHVIYRDVYSTKRNYFVPPQEKLPDMGTDKKKVPGTQGSPVVDPNALPSSLPPAAPSQPSSTGIPGLDAAPPMPMGGM